MRVKQLFIYPWPVTPDDLALLKAAKAELDLDVLVKPVEARIGCEGRILALREDPPWITWEGHALVRDPSNPVSMKAALEWAATKKHDPRAATMLGQLRSILGGEVKEIDPRIIAQENISKNLKLDEGKGVTFK